MQLTRFLERRGLTQQALADALDIPRNTVWRWVNGKATPSAEMLQRLADYFNVSVDELLNGPQPNELKVNIIWTKEDVDMNVLSIEPNEVNFACKPKEIILWGSFPNDLTPEQIAERVKNEFIAACEGVSVRDATRKRLEDE
jgi:transcriptional regulator with XRE-family HTH domain